MRRIILLITVAAVMAVAAMALPGAAFAQSCFSVAAQGAGGIGPAVGGVASSLGQSGTAGEVASNVLRPVQQVRSGVCPPTTTPDQLAKALFP
jgi:hypothetical protein